MTKTSWPDLLRFAERAREQDRLYWRIFQAQERAYASLVESHAELFPDRPAPRRVPYRHGRRRPA